MHFSDRWIRDEINVYAEGSTGVDILDRHKNLFAPGNCSRSEDTFSNGEGAFFANIDGPVRAIRSYLGANSGPLTQRDHFCYEGRHGVRTILRVHAITGVMDFYDYSPDASGMSYYNDLNIDGVLVDGMPMEVVSPGALVWEMITGPQGTLIYSHVVEVDIPNFYYTSYYLDNMDTFVTQCTGDDWAYGSSGIWIDQLIPNTDPLLGAHYNFSALRSTFVQGPDQNVTLAQQRYDQVVQPLMATVLEPSGIAGPPTVKAVVLHQNYPNPFNPKTTISFDLPAAHAVNLAIYAVDGSKVITLWNDHVPAGPHAVEWNGLDAQGKPQASGVYFYRLEAGDFVDMKRMILVR